MAEQTKQAISLQQLEPGQSGVIRAINNPRGPVKRRLVDMGLTPGTTVTVRKIAPFGDPIEVNLRGYELSLRKEDAANILLCAPGEEPHGSRPEDIAPDEETVRRMTQAHEHHQREHGGDKRDNHDVREMKIALVGNPNCGKTTLFNALTGSNQYVGNWPGVTVEKKEGVAHVDGRDVTIVDLPGIYSLSPYSMEEIVARDFVVGEHPDAIINIVDATNLERNLYLTAQLLELERPMVIALNFMDEVEKRGDKLDLVRISRALGVPVIPITARTGENIQKLLQEAHHQMHTGFTVEPDDLYDDFTHYIHHQVDALIHDRAYQVGLPAHWASIKLIEGDELVENALGLDEATRWKVDRIAQRYEQAYPLGDRETLIADARYRFIQRVVKVGVQRGQPLGTMTLRGGLLLQRLAGRGGQRLVGAGGHRPLGVLPAGGRHPLRRRRRAGVSAPDRPALPLPVLPGGLGLYGPGRLYHGPGAAPFRPVRQGVHPHAHGLRVHRARHHGGENHGK